MTSTTDLPVAARTLHVEHCMGTVFTVDIRDPDDWRDTVCDVVGWLHRVDAVFSTYRPDSDISRINRGDLRVADADPLVRVVLDLCVALHDQTDGYFTARHGSRLDPTGVVKGWAIERASEMLRASGSVNHVVNGGGDMQIAGHQAPDEAWQIGISDPRDPSALLDVVSCTDAALATSGITERGAHIRNPFTGQAITDLLSVTVVGVSLATVDALATAALARGRGDAMTWLAGLPGPEALVVRADGTRAHTDAWPGLA